MITASAIFSSMKTCLFFIIYLLLLLVTGILLHIVLRNAWILYCCIVGILNIYSCWQGITHLIRLMILVATWCIIMSTRSPSRLKSSCSAWSDTLLKFLFLTPRMWSVFTLFIFITVFTINLTSLIIISIFESHIRIIKKKRCLSYKLLRLNTLLVAADNLITVINQTICETRVKILILPSSSLNICWYTTTSIVWLSLFTLSSIVITCITRLFLMISILLLKSIILIHILFLII